MHVVKTFIVDETKELIYDNAALSEWHSLVTELGLKGQAQVVQGEASPIPFMHIPKTVMNIFSTLCPRRVDVPEFSISPIPLEVLRLYRLALEEKYFDHMEIWFDNASPDPVLMGMKGYWKQSIVGLDNNPKLEDVHFATKAEGVQAGGRNMRFYAQEYYLMAKWGDVDRSFEELREMAKKRYFAEQEAYYQNQIEDAQQKLKKLQNSLVMRFGA